MAGLQRSAVSFRRQGSSGLVWDDRFISEALNQANNSENDDPSKPNDPEVGQEDASRAQPLDKPMRSAPDPPPPIETVALERNRSTGGGRYRTGRVSPAIEPPSPKVSACGFCGAFRKQSDHARKKAKHGNRRRAR